MKHTNVRIILCMFVLLSFALITSCKSEELPPNENPTADAQSMEDAEGMEDAESMEDLIPADEIAQVVAEQMVEIEKARIEIDGERFAIEGLEPLMDEGGLLFLFNDGVLLFLPIDFTSDEFTPQGEIVVLEESGEEYTPNLKLSDYTITQDGESIVVSGMANVVDREETEALTVVYSEAVMGAGSSNITVEGNEAFVSGDLGTRTYAQLKELLAENPEVDTLVLANISGSVNDAVNMHTGRLVRDAGLNTKVLAESEIFSGGVDLFTSGVKRIVTEGATLGVHSWCCADDKSADELSKEHPAHQGQLAYFTEMLGAELGPDFYFYTLEAAPFDGIHEMSLEDMERFELLTEMVAGDGSETTTEGTNDEGQATSVTSASEEFFEVVSCSDLAPDELEIIPGDEDIICAFVTVPEDHADPSGTQIQLALYIIPSTSDHPAADPVVYLEGGPGGAGVSSVSDFASGASSFLRERSDIIVLDQRGTGYSRPALYCLEMDEIDEQEAGQICHERFVNEEVNLAHYNSHQNALDVDAVRQVLGYQEWNLYGLSYGTRLALTVMRDAPDGLRSVILDSVFPPQVNGLSESPWIIYWVLDTIVATCANDAACQATYPNLTADIEAGILRLSEKPIDEWGAHDYLSILSEEFGEPETPAVIWLIANGEEEEVADFLEQMSDNEEEEEEMEEEIKEEMEEEIEEEIGEDDAEEIASILQPLFSESYGMGYAVVCAEEYPFLSDKALPDNSGNWSDEVRAIIGETPAPFTTDLCPIWDVPAADEVEIQEVASDIPTLILAGSVDVATPPAWSQLAGETLAQSQYVEFPKLGHGVIGQHECINQTISDFLASPESTVDTSCVADMPPLSYTTE